MRRTITFLMTAAMMLINACHVMEESDRTTNRTGRKEVRITINGPCKKAGSADGSKSMVTSSPDRVNDINIFVYSKGRLEENIYTDDLADIIFYLLPDTEYSLYAIANVGKAVPPETEKEAMESRYTAGGISSLETKGFPMSCMTKMTVPAVRDTYTVPINLVRLVAKYSFTVDKSGLSYSDIRITSARIRQSASDIMPFAGKSAASSVSDWDCATAEDIARLNAGGSMEFYMLENCQGVLLPENTEQWEKVPDNIPEKKDICTYLEVGATYRGEGVGSDNLTYRMYLGQDSTTDFNIERNTDNNVTLKVTDDGIYRVSWMVDKGDLIDCRTLSFATDLVEVTKFGDETTLDIIRNPSGIPYRIEANEYAMENFKLTYRQTTANQIALSSTMSESGERSLTLRLVSWDDKLQDECVVRIVDKVGYLCMESWDGQYRTRDGAHGKEMTAADFMTCTDYKVCYNFMGGKNICNYSYEKNENYIHFQLGQVTGYEGRTYWDFNNGAFCEGDPVLEMDFYDDGYLETQLYSYNAYQGDELTCNYLGTDKRWEIRIARQNDFETARETIRNAGNVEEQYPMINQVTAMNYKVSGSSRINVYKWCIREYTYDGIPLQLNVYLGFDMNSTDTSNWNAFTEEKFNQNNRETNMFVLHLSDAEGLPFEAEHIKYDPPAEDQNIFYHPERGF